MTTKKKQDEKVLLGLAAVIAVALIVLGVLSVLSLGKKFNATEAKLKDLSVMEGKLRAEKASESLSAPPVWEGAKIGGRKVDLITSIPVFKINGHKELVDLYEEKGEPVHPPIPNRWWLNHDVDPSYKDSPQRDADQDGFSNLEEFKAKTNPSDSKSYPELVDKLSVVKHEAKEFKILYSSEIGEDQNQFKYFDKTVKRSGLRSQYIAAGGDIFEEEALKGRFKLDKIETREIEKNGFTRQQKFAVITDLKKGVSFEIPKASKNDFLSKDYKVTFKLKALGSGQAFTLDENSRFDLPSGEVSEDGKYHFTEVKNNEAIVLYKNGDQEERVLVTLN